MKTLVFLLLLLPATVMAQQPLPGSVDSYVQMLQARYKEYNYFSPMPKATFSLLRTRPEVRYFAEQRYVLGQLRLAMATQTPEALPMRVMDQTFYMSQAYQGRVFMGGEYFNPFANPYLGPAGYAARGLLAPYFIPGTTTRWVIR